MSPLQKGVPARPACLAGRKTLNMLVTCQTPAINDGVINLLYHIDIA